MQTRKVTGIINDELGAFCSHLPAVGISGANEGYLKGYTFAAKDLYAIKGHRTGAGNPDWLKTHVAETENATTIAALLNAGADLRGKTNTDELAFSLNGENHHYGTPINPAAAGRIPGGSSSGSASAVAGGLVDFALGTDTGGSVRVPASYCGIYGIRTTHGRISKKGVVPLADSFDVVGWFAREPDLFKRVGNALISNEDSLSLNVKTLKVVDEMFDQVSEEHKVKQLTALNEISEDLGLNIEHIRICDSTQGNEELQAWFEAFRQIQVAEVWDAHGAWISEHRPSFGPGLKERFEWAAQSSSEAHKLPDANKIRDKVKAISRLHCDEHSILALPASAGVAPLKADTLTAMDQFRQQAMRLTCLSGLNGFPQVSIPGLLLKGLPIGLSFMSAPNTDKQLLSFTESAKFSI